MGGGGAAGTVDFPSYIKETHADWLYGDSAAAEAANCSSDIESEMDTALSGNPYTGEVAFDPSTENTAITAAVSSFATVVAAYDVTGHWTSAMALAETDFEAMSDAVDTIGTTMTTAEAAFDGMTNAVTPAAEDEISTAVGAFEDLVDERVENDVLPRFQAGMLTINSVLSSSFVMGQADIEAKASRDVNAYQGDLRTKAFLQKDMIDADIEKNRRAVISTMAGKVYDSGVELEKARQAMIATMANTIYAGYVQEIELDKTVMHYTIESNRLQIISQQEEVDRNLELDAFDALWGLEVFQYGATMLGAIGGGRGGGNARPGKNASALGGALSGAAVGSAFGPWGAGIGAVAGGIGGYLTG